MTVKLFYEDMDLFEKSISSSCKFRKTYFYYKNFKTVTEHIADKRNDSMLFGKYKSFGIILGEFYEFELSLFINKDGNTAEVCAQPMFAISGKDHQKASDFVDTVSNFLPEGFEIDLKSENISIKKKISQKEAYTKQDFVNLANQVLDVATACTSVLLMTSDISVILSDYIIKDYLMRASKQAENNDK